MNTSPTGSSARGSCAVVNTFSTGSSAKGCNSPFASSLIARPPASSSECVQREATGSTTPYTVSSDASANICVASLTRRRSVAPRRVELVSMFPAVQHVECRSTIQKSLAVLSACVKVPTVSFGGVSVPGGGRGPVAGRWPLFLSGSRSLSRPALGMPLDGLLLACWPHRVRVVVVRIASVL